MHDQRSGSEILSPRAIHARSALGGESMGVVSLGIVGHIAQTGVPLVIMRTCWGYNWWNKDQYPRKGITVLAHDEICMNGHISKDFPACLGAISPKEVTAALKKILIPPTLRKV